MSVTREPFVKNSNQLLVLTLEDEGQPVPNLQLASRVTITIKQPGADWVIDRAASVDGVDYSKGGGVLEINPGRLPEDQTTLKPGQYPMHVRVYDAQNLEGVRFGGFDSEPKLMVTVYD